MVLWWRQSGCCPKGFKFLEERRGRGSGYGGSPPEWGFWAKETWEERGWLLPPPSCWDGACALLLVR